MNTPRSAGGMRRMLSACLGLGELVERVRQKLWNVVFKARLGGTGSFHIHRSAQIAGAHTIRIGANFYAGPGLRLEAVLGYQGIAYAPAVIFKDNVTLNDYVHIGANHYIEFGNNVLVASKVYVSDHSHGMYAGAGQACPDEAPALRALTTGRSVVIEDNVWIGECVSVLPGVRIGRGSIIGANAVVTRDIEAYCIAVGAPARVVKRYNHASGLWDVVA